MPSTRAVPAALLLVASLALPTAAAAQEPPPPAAPAPAASPSPSPEPPKVDVGGYVDTYYLYNANKTDPALRSFDVRHNAFTLAAADLSVSRTPSAQSRLGFNADLFFGDAADLTSSAEPSSGGKEIYKNIKQAYLSLLTGKVQWDVGKMVSPIGAEVIESQNNWNYSRSTLFGYGEPFYHAGVRATYTVNAKTTLSAMLVNGWNDVVENNGDKTVHFSLTLKPNASLTWVVNDMVGKEAPADAAVRDVRNLFDSNVTWTATPKLSLMAVGDYGSEGPVKWWGIVAYAKYQAIPAWAVAARYEYLDDSKGGFMTIDGKAQTFTITSDHLIVAGLRARLEYRLDHVDRAYFHKSDGSLVANQPTFTVGLVYAFTGKL
ncbi:MAG TPA: porin [Vicinamibacteria bacterium]|nr:porin [Vicinamibacteria bacterium]